MSFNSNKQMRKVISFKAVPKNSQQCYEVLATDGPYLRALEINI